VRSRAWIWLFSSSESTKAWRIDIEPDHVGQLVDEVRIVRELELPITVRLKPVRLPDAPDRSRGYDLG
jgi:hypothetical protein